MAEENPPPQAKAWTYTTPGYPTCLHQSSLAVTPATALKPTQLQIQVKAAALNPVDIQLMNLPVWWLPVLNRAKGIGADFSGVVLRAGSASGFHSGDEVFGLHTPVGSSSGSGGTVAEVLTTDAVHGGAMDAVHAKPRAWSWEQAAALPVVWLTARTVISYVEPHLKLGAESTLAVLGGSSAAGMYVVLLAKQRGWRVVATCSGRNVEFVEGMGADEVVDYTAGEGVVAARLREVRPDAIVDCVGGTDCIGIARRYVTIVGDKTDRAGMGGSALYFTRPLMVLRWLMGKLGVWDAYDCVNLVGSVPWLNEATRLPVDKIVIDSTFGFGQVKEALERLNTGRARGKVVVKIEE